MSTLLWTQPDWQTRAHAWLRAELRQNGRFPIHTIDPFHVRPWSTVMRVETAEGRAMRRAYFKAVTPALAYEAGLTQALARRFPDDAPHVLAHDAARGWLLLADGGSRLRDQIDDVELLAQQWEIVLPRYAALQIALAAQTDDLLRLGVPDRRPAVLPTLYAMLLAHTAVTRSNLTPQERRQLGRAVHTVIALCDRLAASPLPNTLDHADLHEGNLFGDNGRYRLFDWGDSGITFPFFSLDAPLRMMQRRFGPAAAAPVFARLRDAYLEPWTAVAPKAVLIDLLHSADRLAPILAALRWLGALSAVPDPVNSKYGTAVPNLLRHFLAANGVD